MTECYFLLHNCHMNTLPKKYQKIDDICRHFSYSENLPVVLLDYEDVISSHPFFFTLDTSVHYELLTDFNVNPNIISIAETKGHLLMGIVWIPTLPTSTILVGPVKTYKATNNDYIRLLPNTDSLSAEDSRILNAYIHSSPILSYEQFYNKMTLLNYMVNGLESESLNEFSAHNTLFSSTLREHLEEEGYQQREIGVLHNNYQYEKELLKSITLGDSDRLEKLLKKGTVYLFHPKYSPDEMRTLKDDFIIHATLISRAAISGGLDVETALQLCDSYVIAVERCESLEQIHNLSSSMISDYIGRTSAFALPPETPPLIIDCVNYINANLTKAITTQSVADHFGKRREYLSAKFKEYTGYPISEFIMRQRVENAKALLRYTDIPLAQISLHLCFSDQSHFQKVFKKYAGMTPKIYRQTKSEL